MEKTLEAINASQSVWSTVEMQYKLRQKTFVSLWLLVLWCLSPLGGQASLRLLQQSVLTNSTIVPLHYMSTGPAATIQASSVDELDGRYMIAALTTTRESRHEDPVGRLKIPRFEALASTASYGGWREVPSVMEPEDFSALIGLQIVGLPKDRESHFNIESSYVSTDCQPFIRLPFKFDKTQSDIDRLSSLMNFNFTRATSKGWMPGDRDQQHGDALKTFYVGADSGLAMTRLQLYRSPEALSSDTHSGRAVRRRLVVGALHATYEEGRKEYIDITNCTIRETHVESAVFCLPEKSAAGCRVRRMRLSQRDKRPQFVTRFDDPWYAESLTALVSGYQQGSLNSSSWYEYILGNKLEHGRVIHREGNRPLTFIDLRNIPLKVLSYSLSLLLNTHYVESIAANVDVPASTLARYDNATWPFRDIEIFVAKSPPRQILNESELLTFDNNLSRNIMAAVLRGLPFIPAATTATTSVHTPVYTCNWGWLATLLLAAGALFATGAAALALQLRYALPPDVLRYVSSMTIANVHFPTLPPGGTTLDGAERARLLRDLRVRLGDIRGVDGGGDDDDEDGGGGGSGGGGDGADVGEIAFVAADDVATRRLDDKRLYA